MSIRDDDGPHACSLGCGETGWGILENQRRAGLTAYHSSGMQEDIGSRFAMLDVRSIRCDHGVETGKPGMVSGFDFEVLLI